MVKPINWGEMLEPYLQPLKERLGMLPLGQYEDGSVRLAWPGMLTDTLSKGMAAAETPIPAINDDQAWADKSAAMFDMTSLAPMAGAGVAMTGALDNALGSAGGNLMKGASDLPMDLASRMARAREMGFDPKMPLYHGTQAEFDAFDPAYLGGNYGGDKLPAGFDMTPNRKLAEWHADGGNVMELMTKDEVMSPWLDATSSFWAEQPPEVMAAIKALGIDAKPSARTADVLKQISDPEAARLAFIENGVAGMLHGMDDGIAGDGLTYRVFDPRNIRSVNAAFDPSKSDSANLLAANAPSGAAIPTGVEAAQGEQDTQTMTTANILRLLMGGK